MRVRFWPKIKQPANFMVDRESLYPRKRTFEFIREKSIKKEQNMNKRRKFHQNFLHSRKFILFCSNELKDEAIQMKVYTRKP